MTRPPGKRSRPPQMQVRHWYLVKVIDGVRYEVLASSYDHALYCYSIWSHNPVGVRWIRTRPVRPNPTPN